MQQEMMSTDRMAMADNACDELLTYGIWNANTKLKNFIKTGRHRLDLTLKPDASTRDVIAAANSAVDITSFNPAMASMNDIFISTVKSFDQEPQQQIIID